jgi:hypothetical protein
MKVDIPRPSISLPNRPGIALYIPIPGIPGITPGVIPIPIIGIPIPIIPIPIPIIGFIIGFIIIIGFILTLPRSGLKSRLSVVSRYDRGGMNMIRVDKYMIATVGSS